MRVSLLVACRSAYALPRVGAVFSHAPIILVHTPLSTRMRRSYGYLSIRRLFACAVILAETAVLPAMKSSYTCPALRACVALHLAKYLALPNRAACVPLRLCNVYAKVRGRRPSAASALRIFLPATPRISNCSLYSILSASQSRVGYFTLHAVPPPASQFICIFVYPSSLISKYTNERSSSLPSSVQLGPLVLPVLLFGHTTDRDPTRPRARGARCISDLASTSS